MTTTIRRGDLVRNTLNNHIYLVETDPSPLVRCGRPTGVDEVVVRRMRDGKPSGLRVRMDTFHLVVVTEAK